ncbi:MAG: sigma-70 family RNA polymerase sigma factor [Phycisphaerae bacterium]|nr:sigma-70 family RNA polymerase sigma factor [Phycisphaerae bacterium]
MRGSDRTKIGGSKSTFLATQWSQINAFAGLNPDEQQAILADLMAGYWKPVYCYLRRKGHGNEEAKDLTQGFFQEIVMGRHLVEQADEAKGRFRTLLLTALDRYVISMHRQQTAAKRRPAMKISLPDDADDALSVMARDMRPEEAFTHAWACDLIREVLAEVQSRCTQDDKQIHWQLFYRRIVEPLLANQEAPPLSQLCEEYGVPTAVKAENMIVTVRKRFQTAMKDRVRQYVASEDEVDQEIRDLMEILSR